MPVGADPRGSGRGPAAGRRAGASAPLAGEIGRRASRRIEAGPSGGGRSGGDRPCRAAALQPRLEAALRKLTRLPTATDAARLVDILVGDGIDARADADADGAEVWVVDDARLPEARALLDAYRATPDAPRFVAAARRAGQQREARAAEQRRREAAATALDRARRPLGVGPVTIVVLLCAVAMTALGVPSLAAIGDAIVDLPATDRVEWAFIDDLRLERGPEGPRLRFLGAIRAGEIWRLVTPSFVHTGGLLHLVFNGYWVWIFGRQIETRRGWATLAALVLVFGAVSMVAQYAVGFAFLDASALARGIGPTFTIGPVYLGSPIAGGLSGTLYGLFGYIWAKSATDRFSGLGVPSSTVGVLIVWLLVCFTGSVGPIANIAHAAGLVAGVLWGAVGHRIHRSL